MVGRRQGLTAFPVIALVIALCFPCAVRSQRPATLPFHDCFSGNTSRKLSVSTVYAQILDFEHPNSRLNITLLGASSHGIFGFENDSNLATLFTSTSVLTFNLWTNSSYLCSTLRPPSPLRSNVSDDGTYCPIPPGPFGLSTSIPWTSSHSFTTLGTRLRAVDGFNTELFCLDVSTTPLDPGDNNPFGNAIIIKWSTIALTLAYFLVVGGARIASAWGRGASRPAPGWWPKVERAGFVFASAVSGERLSSSRALLRFCTPSMRDIVFHCQWCVALGLVAVQWPAFVYPILSQTAWSMLLFNITLSRGARTWHPLSVEPFNPPASFRDQLSDINSPLFIDPNTPNRLFALPLSATPGITSFAFAVGLFPQDLFGVCLKLFLAIIAGTIAISSLVWFVDWIATVCGGAVGTTRSAVAIERSPRFSAHFKDSTSAAVAIADENRITYGPRPGSRFALSTSSSRKTFWRMRPGMGSLHGYVLHGNLVRIMVWFHLPITIFSCFQMTSGRSRASLQSIVLAAFSFIGFSVVIPIFLVLRVKRKTTHKLYDETRTLLCLGPLYNHYRHGSQLFACLLFATNLAFGVTIGCGQRSGTAQAVLILVIEVASALVTSVRLPWGQGASMSLISFFFCVARIVIAVLLVILSPAIGIGDGPGGWIAYGILLVLALVFLAFSLMLLVKLVEGAVRIFGGIGFHRSNHALDSGILGVCSQLEWRRSRRRKGKRRSAPLGSPLAPTMTPKLINSPPPSVLRPEHALRPYREESDDETGFIMGAWQPFPASGEPQAPEVRHSVLPAPVASTSTSGFARVGGGRAHFETPYAIANRSTLTFPSTEHADEVPPTLAVRNSSRVQTPELPPGAMPPHIRTKSYTAVIEHPAPSLPTPLRADTFSVDDIHDVPTSVPDGPSSPPVAAEGGDTSLPKKRPWYLLRKGNDREEGSVATRGRSFVVIRSRRSPMEQERRRQLSGPEAWRQSEAVASTSNQQDQAAQDTSDSHRPPPYST